VSHAIEVHDLGVSYGETAAVTGVTFDIDFASTTVLLGPNGAGKTTTTETLLGFRSPTHGQVRITGLDPVAQHRDVIVNVGALLQRGGVWAPMSPKEVLALTATYYPAPRDPRELIDQLSLTKCANTPWRRLSGGEQQRTLLALALLGRPRVLVLDEPTAAVDPDGHRVIREMLRAERNRGCALLVTTHQLDDAEELADHVIIMNEGRIVQQGTLASFRGEPVTVFESKEGLDVAALSSALSAPVVAEGRGRYRVEGAAVDVSVLSGALNNHGAALESFRTRATLEETYLQLVNDDRTRSQS
jgi:ABC-2 type transport system ATP-binding protein